MDIYFEVMSCLGRRIRISREHWTYLVQMKHPELSERAQDVQNALMDADFVRLSRVDLEVCLYYKQIGKYYLCVVCRHFNGEGFIITSYLTDREKEGKEIWRR